MGDSIRVRGIRGARLSALFGGLLLTLGVGAPAAGARPWSPVAVSKPGYAGAGNAPIGLRVIPFPGTPDAPPASRIIFSALRPSDLRSVTVTGSRSGAHRGRLEPLPAGAGTAFVPDHPFTADETVRVDAALSSPRAGTESGDQGATQLRFAFRVAVPVTPLTPEAGRPRGDLLGPQSWFKATGHGPTQYFHSEPNLHPPVVNVTADPDTTSGDIFITPLNSPQVGPMILNPSGQLVWFEPYATGDGHASTANLAVQHYGGQPVLTWWQGKTVGGVVESPSEDLIMDPSYRTVAVVHAGYGYVADQHEFQLTSQGTAYLDSAVITQTNLTSVGGPPRGAVMDYVIQEVDVKSGKVLWEWHALGHVPVSASYMPYVSTQPFYDYFHLNSIQQLPDGNLLISARDTCAVYEISRATGKVIWALGGRSSDFKMGPGTTFWWQHDARLRGRTLSIFDDAAYPQKELQSSAKFLHVDPANHAVSLVRQFTHFPPVIAGAGGDVQPLPNGNVFVGWGSQPQFSEFTSSGQQIFNGSFALRLASYRAFRFPWIGHPDTPPSLAVAPGPDGHVTAYTSWNGATQVTDWRLLGGGSAQDLVPLGVTASRGGFETAIDITSEPRYFAVQALDRKGSVLSTSSARADPPHLALFGSNIFVASTGGSADVPVGCLAAHACRVTVTIRSRGSDRGRSVRQVVPAWRAALVNFSVAPSGMHELRNASHHRLKVEVTVRSSSGVPSVGTSMTLIPFSAHGAATIHQRGAAGVQIVGTTDFVSPAGQAGILTACYSSSPCHIKETLSIGRLLVGRSTRSALIGANELAYIPVQLSQTGQRLLSHARGNRLLTRVEFGDGAQTRTSQIDLVRYS